MSEAKHTAAFTLLHQRALDAVRDFVDAATYEETLWDGYGEQIVPPSVEMRRIKAGQALAALRDAQPVAKAGGRS